MHGAYAHSMDQASQPMVPVEHSRFLSSASSGGDANDNNSSQSLSSQVGLEQQISDGLKQALLLAGILLAAVIAIVLGVLPQQK